MIVRTITEGGVSGVEVSAHDRAGGGAEEFREFGEDMGNVDGVDSVPVGIKFDFR